MIYKNAYKYANRTECVLEMHKYNKKKDVKMMKKRSLFQENSTCINE